MLSIRCIYYFFTKVFLICERLSIASQNGSRDTFTDIGLQGKTA